MRSKSAERFARKQEVLLLLFHADMDHDVVVDDGGDVEDEHQDHEMWTTRLDDNHGCGHENNGEYLLRSSMSPSSPQT